MRTNTNTTSRRKRLKDTMIYLWIFSGKYIFIRYNPDKYIDKLGKSKNPMFETRMEILEKSINKHIKRIENGENHDLVEIHHLLYDED